MNFIFYVHVQIVANCVCNIMFVNAIIIP